MTLLFILPAIGRKDGEEYIGTWKMEPLMIAALRAITPTDIKTFLFDDRIEDIDYETDVDLVAISVETYTASRAYRIAEQFRRRNIPVIMGGYHVTAYARQKCLRKQKVPAAVSYRNRTRMSKLL